MDKKFLLDGKNSNALQRSLETQHQDRIKNISGALYSLFLNPSMIPAFWTLQSMLLNKRHFNQGQGVFRDFYFNGLNPYFHQQQYQTLEVFKSLPLLNDILSRQDGIYFNAHPDAQKAMINYIEQLIDEKISFESDAFENFFSALQLSQTQGKKIVLLSNHASHTDGAVFTFIINKLLVGHHKKLRMYAGAYMFYSNFVNKYMPCFDTALVFGPKDYKQIAKFLIAQGKRNVMELLEQKKKDTLVNHLDEILLLFPYGGREFDNPIGCKDSFPKGIDEMLCNEHCIYLPVSLIGTKEMIGTRNIPFVGNVSVMQSQKLHVGIGEHFIGQQLSLEGINNVMHSIGKKTYHSYQKKFL